jgi:hypothetical protein
MMQTTASVVLDGVERFVRLQLLDANRERVALPHDLWKTAVELEPGAYLARFSTSAWQRTEGFVVLPGETHRTVSPGSMRGLLVRSAGPLDGSHAFHSAHAEAVGAITPPPVNTAGGEGSLLIVLRRAPAAPDERPEGTRFEKPHWDLGVRLHSASGEPVHIASAAVPKLPAGLQAVNLALPDGAYELHLATGAERDFVSQTLFVVRGWQTRVFLLDETHILEESRIPWAAAALSVHFTAPGEVFHPSSPGLLAAEELMNVCERDGVVNPPPEWHDYSDRVDCPTLDLAFCLAQMDPWREHPVSNTALLAALHDRFPSVADVAILWHTAAVRRADARPEDPPPFVLDRPPMSTRAWDIALFGETQNTIAIPPGSRAARQALSAVNIGPWLRFLVNERRTAQAPAGGAEDAADVSDPGIFGPEFEPFVAWLRDFVTRQVTVRIQFGSSHFALAERRLLSLLCPHVDSTVFHILRDAARSGGPTAIADSASRDLVRLPSENAVVQCLRLPRVAIQELANSALAKLSVRTVLPTDAQLDTFVIEETREESVLLEPLGMLRHKPSGVLHAAERQSLSLLSVLYLRYRGTAGRPGAGLSSADIAALLNRLGFQIPGERPRRVRGSDITRALRESVDSLASFLNIDYSAEGGVWEDLEVRLRAPRQYRPGHLFIVKRYISPGTLPQDIANEWTRRPLSYSMSLAIARQRTPGLEHLRRTDTRSRKGASSRRIVSYGEASRSRYESEVRRYEKATLDETRALLMKGAV